MSEITLFVYIMEKERILKRKEEVRESK